VASGATTAAADAPQANGGKPVSKAAKTDDGGKTLMAVGDSDDNSIGVNHGMKGEIKKDTKRAKGLFVYVTAAAPGVIIVHVEKGDGTDTFLSSVRNDLKSDGTKSMFKKKNAIGLHALINPDADRPRIGKSWQAPCAPSRV